MQSYLDILKRNVLSNDFSMNSYNKSPAKQKSKLFGTKLEPVLSAEKREMMGKTSYLSYADKTGGFSSKAYMTSSFPKQMPGFNTPAPQKTSLFGFSVMKEKPKRNQDQASSNMLPQTFASSRFE